MSDDAAVLQGVAPTATAWLRRDTYVGAVDGGCKVADANQSFTLSGDHAYRTLTSLAPHLSGMVTRADLEAALGEHGWAVVCPMLDALTSAGMLRWIGEEDRAALPAEDAEKWRDQVAFLSQYLDTPHRALATYMDTTYAVPGTSFLSDAIATNLADNGARHVTRTGDDADIVIYDFVPDTAGPNALVITQIGSDLWALPYAWSPASPAWSSALPLLGEPGDLEAAEPVQRLFGALVAYEVFKGVTGAIAPETDGGALGMNVATGQTSRHRFIVLGQAEPADTLEPEPVPYESHADMYATWEELSGSELLPARAFDDLDLEQVPFKVTVLETAAGRVAAASPWTTADARIEAIRTAYETALTGAWDGAGVALEEEGLGLAGDRAARSAITAFLRGQASLAGLSCPPPSGRVGTFVAEVATSPITWVDLGRVGSWHAGMARSGDRWQIGVGADLNEALSRAGTDLVASHQIPDWKGSVAPEIREEPGGIPVDLEVRALDVAGLAGTGLVAAVAVRRERGTHVS